MTNRTLMVLGGSVYQVPVIEAAKRLKVRTVCIDMYAAPPAAALADVFVQCSTLDVDAALKIARDHKVDGVIAAATDVAVYTQAIIAAQLGLPGVTPAAARRLTDKSEFRKHTKSGVPDWCAVDPNTRPTKPLFGFPAILKPNRSSGGLGALRVETLTELMAAWEAWDDQQQAGGGVVEAWYEGVQLSAEGFLRDGRVESAVVTHRLCPAWPHVSTIGHRWPSGLSPAAEGAVLRAVEDMLGACGVTTAPFDADIVYTGDGHCRVLEASPRTGGNRITDIFGTATGLDLIEYSIGWALGEADSNGTHSVSPRANAAGIDILKSDHPGIISYIDDGLESARHLSGIQAVEMDYPNGASVPAFTSSRSRLGTILASAASIGALENLMSEARDRIGLVVTLDAPS